MSAYPTNIDVNQIVRKFNQEIKNAKTMEDICGLEDDIFVLTKRLKVLQENLNRRADKLELYESYILQPNLVVGEFRISEFAGNFIVSCVKTNKEIKRVCKKHSLRWLGSAEAMESDPEVQEIIASLK